MSITVTKSLNIDYVIPGEVVTYTIEVENTSSEKFINAILYDDLSKCTQYLLGTLYIDNEPSFDYPFVGIKLGDIDGGKSKTIKFNVYLDYDICECTMQPKNTNPIINKAYVKGYFQSTTPPFYQTTIYSNTTSLRVFCHQNEDFLFEKSFEENENIITYTLVAKNKSPIPLLGVHFEDPLDPCTEIIPGTWQQSIGIQNVPFTMEPKSTVTVTFKAKIINSSECMSEYKRDYISNKGLWYYTIKPPYFRGEIGYQHNVIHLSNLVTIPISCECLNLKIEKECCKCKVCLNEQIPYTIKITNAGSIIVNDITIEDIISQGMYVNSMISAIGAIYEQNGKVVWNIPKLEPKESAIAMIVMIATEKVCLYNGEYILNRSRIVSYNGISTVKDMSDTVIINIDCHDCNCKD